MSYTIEQIAHALGATALGDVAVTVTGVREPADATADDLALAMKPEYAQKLSQGSARAALVWDGADWQALGLKAAIVAPRPRYVMSGLSTMFDPGQGWDEGIHPSAVIHETAQLGENVSVGPLAVICAGARIGAGSVIGPQSFVGTDAVLGEQAFLREGARIGARVVIGDRFIAQPNAVVGADGFSYVTPDVSGVERARQSLGDQGDIASQSYVRIHSLGAVRIGDDVEVGAHSAVDRGTIRDTVVGDRTKIDNLVQVGHNCVIGTDCLLCGLVGLAGSVKVGNNVVLAGQVGVADNIFIGDNVIAGGGTKLLSNVPAGRVMLGYPAMKMDTQMEVYKYLRRIKRLFADVADLKKAVSKPDQVD
ncbi:UDP-3-O-(3-hydroxymyristoyl) glucosamine N-acyltransferase [Roseovarius atlanticus]|uniref:UDP-3-O-(3-hydroxymyristoyl) glucosamine N-acyltransferase n=1 Tax=Roseovarius atlanticus TaxID=1641875 RepID=A0A0T5NZD9_9RHOB|nr:UDP-3-O-(3-hydroxymyristoyl)glucosamine N-acyltransferase [Roseovarius atlanticus]KRS14266.1 UDP-3-O-(3-hydroxymyristoyl) glucosamine N-acyltransferase [Roseovarius atlanticus]